METAKYLEQAIQEARQSLSAAMEQKPALPAVREVGTVVSVGEGVVQVTGLRGVQYEEVIRFAGGETGLAFDLGREETGVVLLDEPSGLFAGAEAFRTGRVLDTPVGDGLLGRIVDPRGRPLDGAGPVHTERRLPVERHAPAILDRKPVTVQLHTGIKVIDALIPIGRGQRELILGDRQTGKTAICVDAIINQKPFDVLCIYCAIGKRSSAVAKVVADLSNAGAMNYTVVVIATEENPPGLQYMAPYAATSMGEHFMEAGRDVLVVFDDLTRHARAYRELSLLLRRPPGREAYPGDIFYIHSRLLERSTHLDDEHGGGSLSALPVIETEAQNISAYIPTNLISITDGQVYLSPELFQKGSLPAVDVGKSVSRVGGKTQLPAYRAVASDLRLSYSQFEELEIFSRFGTRLDPETKKTLARGRRVREILKQPQYATMPAADQVAVLYAVNQGVFDNVELSAMAEAQEKVIARIREKLPGIREKIHHAEKLSDQDKEALKREARAAVEEQTPREDGQKPGRPEGKAAGGREKAFGENPEQAKNGDNKPLGEKQGG
ncbi:MAG: alternate F1F0 ATPase, F1 subunit alpha [Deltaproteobacteria bacterium]|nr:alternate F1F0 ATPase, F1 subunit alpha [Deltaproteobacteria bacterium]